MIERIENLVKEKSFLDALGITENVTVTEIRKGKVNHIFKLTDATKNKSYILKKSETYLTGINLPIASGVSISVSRNYNEAKVLKYIAENISDRYVPKVVMINKEESYFVMECLNEYRDVRDIFLDMSIPNGFAEELSHMLSSIYIKTADVGEKILGIDNRCMMDVLLMILIKAPYDMSIVKSNKALVDVEFFLDNIKDEILLNSVSALAYKLKNCKQALLNGDLHLGSIFYKESYYKIYDFEFAFKGPVGYEIGKIIAHLILAYHYALITQNLTTAKSILQQTAEFYDKIFEKLEKNEIFSDSLIREETIKFCGLELISRVTGILQLKYISNISDTNLKDNVQKDIFKIGLEMVNGNTNITTGKELIDYVC